MKLKKGFLLQQVAGMNLVVSTGEADFDGMITLNDSGVFLWNRLAEGADRDVLASALAEEYGIPQSQAQTDTDAFLKTLADAAIIE